MLLPAVAGSRGLPLLLAVGQAFEPPDDASEGGAGLVTIDAGAASPFVEHPDEGGSARSAPTASGAPSKSR
jgi:hypothetical protein